MNNIRGILPLLLCGLTAAQPANQAFEAASIKPAGPLHPDAQGRTIMPRLSGGPGTQDPGRLRYPYRTLRELMTIAYDVKTFQISGPPILDTERFDLDATLPPQTTKEQLRGMLQNLLAERFQTKIHRETKELPVFSMVVARGGSKLKETVDPVTLPEGEQPLPPPLSSAKMGPDGFPVIPVPAGAPIIILMMNGRARMMGQQKTMAELAERLTGLTSRPVVDATGLKATYDFTLTYAPEGTNSPMPPQAPGGVNGASTTPTLEAEPLPDIFGALQAQLGLRLEAKKAPVEMIVVDHVEKTPTEN